MPQLLPDATNPGHRAEHPPLPLHRRKAEAGPCCRGKLRHGLCPEYWPQMLPPLRLRVQGSPLPTGL